MIDCWDLSTCHPPSLDVLPARVVSDMVPNDIVNDDITTHTMVLVLVLVRPGAVWSGRRRVAVSSVMILSQQLLPGNSYANF